MSQNGGSLSGLKKCFSNLKDPRRENHHRKKHSVVDIVAIGLCAVICGAQGWEDIADFGKIYFNFLKTFLDLPNGAPSKDTYRRVFGTLDPEAFYDSFLKWIRSVSDATQGGLVAIDGKTLRHSFDTAKKQHPLHLVTAWAVENQVVLGQMGVDQKSNEITAVPKLLDLLNLKGMTVTVDAMNCQTDIVEKIVDKGGHYVFAVKGNQAGLYRKIQKDFERWENDKFESVSKQSHQTVEKDHGRIEIRNYHQVAIRWPEAQAKWKNLKTAGMVEAHRTIGEKTSIERRYFISDHDLDVKQFAYAVRGHWGIENSQHWCLDMIFNEDACRIRDRVATKNFASLRRMALSLLKNAPEPFPITRKTKMSMRRKSKCAGWDPVNYLSRILTTKI